MVDIVALKNSLRPFPAKEETPMRRYSKEGIAATAASHLDGVQGELGVVWDIGAHIGGFTKAALARDASLVVSLEPSAENYRRLVAENACPRLMALNMALWTERGEVPLRSLGNSGQNLVVISGGTFVDMVPTVRVKDLLKIAPTPNVLKVDIEGAEWALMHDKAFCEVMRNADHVHFEVHDLDGKWVGDSPVVVDMEFMSDALSDCGYGPVPRNSGGWLTKKEASRV